MIKKSFEINKLDRNEKNFFLFYGKNEELRIHQQTFYSNKKEIFSYEERKF